MTETPGFSYNVGKVFDCNVQVPFHDKVIRWLCLSSSRKAHQANYVAVMGAYGLSTKGDVTELSCGVAFLIDKYREITER